MLEQLAEAAGILAELEAGDAHLGIELGSGRSCTVPLRTLAFVTIKAECVVLVLVDGTELTARPSKSLVSVAARLAAHPAFVRAQNGYLVNLDLVDRITRTGQGKYVLDLTSGQQVPLLQNQQAVMDYFQLKRLDHVDPWNERQAIILKENLRDFDDDIRRFPNEDIFRLFSDGTGQLIIKQVIGNIIWQAYSWILAGKLPLFDGNLRSFWYSHIKPVLGRVLTEIGENQYESMSGVFAQYVGEYHLFHYSDFGFVEDNDSSRIIGAKCPQVIVLAEKRGHWRTLQTINDQTGATAISLGGQPSLMTTEYFVADLAKAVPLDQPFHLIADVDYDPSGQIIAESFQNQLRAMGVKNTTLHYLILPVNFTADELKYFQYPVKNVVQGDQTKVKQWMHPDKRTYPNREPGGIPDENGVLQPMGLESDAMPRKRIIDLAVAEVQNSLHPDGKRHGPAIHGFPYP